jgi:opine dehydrogenase
MSDSDFRAVVESMLRRTATDDSADDVTRVAVLGAGPVGQLLACEALAAGLDVRLFSAFERELRGLRTRGSVTVRGAHLVGTYAVTEAPGRTPSIVLSPSVDAAVEDADAVFVATPASAHATYAGLLSSSLRHGQLLVLVPGRFLGSVEVSTALHRHRCAAEVTVAELSAAPYVVSARDGRLIVHAVARIVALATLPAAAAGVAVDRLSSWLPMLRAADSVLETSFAATSALVTVPPVLLNSAALETAPDDERPLLRDLLTPGIAVSVVDALDRERRAVAFQYGVGDLDPVATAVSRAYGGEGADVSAVVRSVEGFDDLPVQHDHGPHVVDEVATSLVPLASAAEVAGIPTPTTDAVVGIASALAGADLARQGRTLASLGLAGQRPADLRRALASHDDTARRVRPAALWRVS